MPGLALARRSIRFLSINRIAIRVVIILDVDDADALSARGDEVVDELLSVVSKYASSFFQGGGFHKVDLSDKDGAPIETRTEVSSTLTTHLELRALPTPLTLLVRIPETGGFSPEAAASFEVVARCADKAAAAERTSSALASKSIFAKRARV
jgi:hypothetical protein